MTRNSHSFAAAMGALSLLAGLACESGAPPSPAPPSFYVQPAGKQVASCAEVVFTGGVEGGRPLEYQWFKDGVAIAGANGPALRLTKAGPGDAGSYTLVAKNDLGSATSDPAILTVTPDDPPPGTQRELSAVGGLGIVVDGTSVYWTSNAGIQAAGKTCGESERVLYHRGNSVERPDPLALSAGRLVWADGNLGFVATIPVAGGQPTMLAPQLVRLKEVYSLVLTGDQAYWSDPYGANIEWTSLGGGPVTVWPVGTYPSNLVNGITADDRFVYWCDMGAHTISRMPLGGGDVVTLASAPGYLTGIATDGVDVLWAEAVDEFDPRPPGSIRKVARDGGTPTTLATLDAVPLDLVLDGDVLYWTATIFGTTSSPSGSLWRVRKDNSAPAETLASGLDSPYGLTVDAQYVYWVESPFTAPGRVMKQRK